MKNFIVFISVPVFQFTFYIHMKIKGQFGWRTFFQYK